MVVSFFHLEISLCLVVTNSTKESYKNIEAAISTQIHVSSHIRLFTTCLYIYIDDCNWVAPHLSFSAARISARGALPLHLVLLSPLSLHLSFPAGSLSLYCLCAFQGVMRRVSSSLYRQSTRRRGVALPCLPSRRLQIW